MRKSEIYTAAMCSVVEDGALTTVQKLEIIAVLMNDMELAAYSEKMAAEEQAKAEMW